MNLIYCADSETARRRSERTPVIIIKIAEEDSPAYLALLEKYKAEDIAFRKNLGYTFFAKTSNIISLFRTLYFQMVLLIKALHITERDSPKEQGEILEEILLTSCNMFYGDLAKELFLQERNRIISSLMLQLAYSQCQLCLALKKALRDDILIEKTFLSSLLNSCNLIQDQAYGIEKDPDCKNYTKREIIELENASSVFEENALLFYAIFFRARKREKDMLNTLYLEIGGKREINTLYLENLENSKKREINQDVYHIYEKLIRKEMKCQDLSNYIGELDEKREKKSFTEVRYLTTEMQDKYFSKKKDLPKRKISLKYSDDSEDPKNEKKTKPSEKLMEKTQKQQVNKKIF